MRKLLSVCIFLCWLSAAAESAFSKYLYPEFCTPQSFLTPSPSDVNMDSPSPNSKINSLSYDCEFQDKSNSDTNESNIYPTKNVPVTYIRVEHIGGENENGIEFSEKLVNEENMKRSAISYPGQAVQIISTTSGNKIVNQVSESSTCKEGEDEPVASVQIQITKEGIKVISDKETTV